MFSHSFSVCILCPVCAVQWKREQDFDLQLLERAVQGEEAQLHRSVQGEERPPEHHERPRPHSDEWLTFCSTTMTRPANELDLEPLDYGLDLKKEVTLALAFAEDAHMHPHGGAAPGISGSHRSQSWDSCSCQANHKGLGPSRETSRVSARK